MLLLQQPQDRKEGESQCVWSDGEGQQRTGSCRPTLEQDFSYESSGFFFFNANLLSAKGPFMLHTSAEEFASQTGLWGEILPGQVFIGREAA